MLARCMRILKDRVACAFVWAIVFPGGMRAQDSLAYRLTVRPQSMAVGKTNPAAGVYPLTTVPNAEVSAPAQCAGTNRCPVFIFLPGAGQPATHLTEWLRPVADKYGMLLLTVTTYDVATIDAALHELLTHYAVDVKRIAIIGRCASGEAGMRFGLDNPEIFSRVASISGGVIQGSALSSGQRRNARAQVLVDKALHEFDNETFAAVQSLRKQGYPVTTFVSLRGHEDQTEDYDFLGRWLQQTWTKPDPEKRRAPAVVADPLPVLTSDIMTKMITFWTNFAKEPDSIRTTVRQKHLHEVVVPVGDEHLTTFMVDMPALATQSPAVARDLQAAGLTARQHDAYRVALISVQVTKDAEGPLVAPSFTSTLGRNVAFADAHLEELRMLARAGIEHPEILEGLGGNLPSIVSNWRANPAAVKDYGAMGIWRTP